MCAACGSPLVVDGKRATCSQPSCPGGGNFYLCGYCESFSLSLRDLQCCNSRCRLFGRRRSQCPECNNLTRIAWAGQKICLYRGCPSNEGALGTCFFCGKESLLSHPDLMFCTRSKCQRLLQPVRACAFCDRTSFVVDERACRNLACPRAGLLMDRCPACGRYSVQADGGVRRCLAAACGRALSNGSESLVDLGRSLILGVREGLPREKGPGAIPEAVARRLPPGDGEDAGAGVEPGHADPGSRRPLTSAGSRPVEEPDAAAPAVAADGEDRALPRSPATPARPEGPMSPGETPPPGLAERVTAPRARPAGGTAGVVEPQGPFAPPREAPSPQTPRPVDPPPREPRKVDRSLVSAYRWALEHFIGEGEGEADGSPLILIVGLPGAGKTTFLTVLGDILRARGQKYHFPYPGIDVRHVPIDRALSDRPGEFGGDVRSRVLDLVYDFSEPLYATYLANGLWPRPTPREAMGGTTRFLVSEIVRHERPLARLVTIETSGEDYADVLSHIAAESPAQGGDLPYVLRDLMDRATGFVVLLDPANPDTDRSYEALFLALREEIRPRAMNAFHAALKERLSTDYSRGDLRADVEAMQEAERGVARRKKLIEEEREDLVRRIEALDRLIETQGVDVVTTPAGELVRVLQRALQQIIPDRVRDVEEEIRRKGGGRDLLLAYYRGLLRESHRHSLPLAEKLVSEREGVSPPTSHASDALSVEAAKVRNALGLDPGWTPDVDPALPTDLPVRRFRRLAHVALVVTKADMYPIVYPPDRYPERKLPRCWNHVRPLISYLRLVGGDVRYYNTSVTGYTVLQDLTYRPGPETTMTPINVVEPVFDMLGIS